MSNDLVGAKIVDIITKSLYDSPIVVFREYVQNSVDSFVENDFLEEGIIEIKTSGSFLAFIDNGSGVEENMFYPVMKKIADSTKKKEKDIGYKGIGRLSGISYCKKLIIVNILDVSQKRIQCFEIDCQKYESKRDAGELDGCSVNELFGQIATERKVLDEEWMTIIQQTPTLGQTNKGFAVFLIEPKPVLKKIIEDKDLATTLGWLLPVRFSVNDSCPSEWEKVIRSINSNNDLPKVRILLNNQKVQRETQSEMIRKLTSYIEMDYGFVVINLSPSKIAIDKKNGFSGCRLYMDNMLVCQEVEIIDNLKKMGILEKSESNMLQVIRGLGVLIFITDKYSISSNARRTFFELINEESINLLKYIGELFNNIYDARYAISYYGLEKEKGNSTKLDELKGKVQDSVSKLISGEFSPEEVEIQYNELKEKEKRKWLRTRLVTDLRKEVNQFIGSVDTKEDRDLMDEFLTYMNRARIRR